MPDCPVNKFWISLFAGRNLCRMWLDAQTYMLACTFSVHLPQPNPFCWFRDFLFPGIFAPRSESSLWELSLPGMKVPGNFRSQERKLPGTFVPGSKCSRKHSFRRAIIPGSELCTSNYKLYITHKLTLKPIY